MLPVPSYNALLLVNHGGGPNPLADAVDQAGMSFQIQVDMNQLDDEGSGLPDVVMLDLASLEPTAARQFVDVCKDRRLPVLAAVPRESVANYDPALNPDELLVCPVSEEELAVRVKQAVFRVKGPTGSQVLSVGDLSIDLERYDVSVDGRRVSLTCKEFQLLVLLASNPGRVYTRSALLRQVWGYDYLGGRREPWMSTLEGFAPRWKLRAGPSWKQSGT